MTNRLRMTAALVASMAAIPVSSGHGLIRPVRPAFMQQPGGFGTHAALAPGAIHLSPVAANSTSGQGPTGNIGGPPPPVVTPEPLSMTLLATGLAGLGGYGLRKRRRKSPPDNG